MTASDTIDQQVERITADHGNDGKTLCEVRTGLSPNHRMKTKKNIRSELEE